MAVLVGYVVGDLELMEGHHLLHPLLTRGGRIRVYVHPLGHLRVGFSRHHPPAVVELVATVVRGDNVHQQDVLGLLVQAGHSDLEGGEHSPVKERVIYKKSRLY